MNFQLPCQSLSEKGLSQSCWLWGCYAKDNATLAVVGAPKQYRWLTTIVRDMGDPFVYSVVFLTELKLPRKGVRIDVDSLCIPPFLEEKKKKHSMTCAAHALFAS